MSKSGMGPFRARLIEWRDTVMTQKLMRGNKLFSDAKRALKFGSEHSALYVLNEIAKSNQVDADDIKRFLYRGTDTAYVEAVV